MRDPTLPPWLAERVALGELPAPLLPETQQRLERADASAQLEALRAQDAAFFTRFPVGPFAARVRVSIGAGAQPKRRRVRPLVPLALAGAALGLLLVVRGPTAPRESGAELGRAKGLTPHLTVYRRGPDGPEPLLDGAQVRAGDVLQLGYVAAGERYGAVVSVDGSGHATLHFPVHGERSADLEGAGEVPLPRAFQLDDAPAFEAFYLVTSDEPFSAYAAIGLALRAAASPPGAPVPPPPGMHLASLRLEKTRP